MSATCTVRHWGNLLLASWLAVGSTPALALNEDYRSLSVPYSSGNPTVIGSGIDVDLINQQRSTCLNIAPDAIRFLDGNGAVKTDATIELVSDYKTLANTLNIEVDYKSKADIGIAALKAGSSVEFSSKYENFAKDESRSLAIVMKASSDFGRKGLSDYVLKKEFADLLANDQNALFRAKCGTHTVVAQQNMVMVAVVVLLSDVSSSSKRALEATYKSSISASGSIAGAELAGSVDKKVVWKSLVEAAGKVGKMNVQFASVGGAGVTDALKVMTIPDPANIEAVLKTLSEAGASFTQPNSAPAKFLLVSNSVFGLKSKIADTSKLEALNSYYLQLARVDYALARINGYKTSFPALYAAEYAVSKNILELRSYRTQLVTAIEACVLKEDCGYKPPQSLGILFIEDIILPETLTLQCSYRRFDSKDGKVRLNILDDAAVILRGRARLTEYVGLETAFLGRVGPVTDPPRKFQASWQAFAASPPQPDKTVRVIAQLDNLKFEPDVVVSEGAVAITNEPALVLLLNSLLNSIYTVNIQAKSGVFIQNSIGPAFGGKCPLKQAVL